MRGENNLNTIVNQTFDMCGVLNGTDSNPFGKWTLSLLDGFVSKVHIHPCPYLNETVIVNPVLSNPMISNFLKGSYLIKARLYNNKDINIITGHVWFDLR